MRISEDVIQERLLQPSDWPSGGPSPSGLMDGPPKPAAVLLPLLRRKSEWHLLYIRRSERKRDRHSGQVAFPGGRVEPDDRDAMHTALREAEEEVGIASEHVRLLGRLRPYHTTTHYQVTPVVGVIPWPYPLQLQRSEVARTFTIPLRWLSDPRNYGLRQHKTSPRLAQPELRAEMPVVYYDEYDGETLWGATARMTLSFLHTVDAGGLDGQLREEFASVGGAARARTPQFGPQSPADRQSATGGQLPPPAASPATSSAVALNASLSGSACSAQATAARAAPPQPSAPSAEA